MTRIIIRNGTVVSPHSTLTADILIDGEKIAGITAPGAVSWQDARAIDATGCYVFPGVVDVHTHIQLDTGVFQTDDNWEIGTKSAAYGGVTTVVDFATQFRGQTFRVALDNRLEECKPAVIDYGLHMMVTDLARDPEQAARDLAALRDMGVPSIKLYTTYRPNYYADDATILHTLNAMPEDMIAMFHCENDDLITDTIRRLEEAGNTGWEFHGDSRPAEAETLAAISAVNLLPRSKFAYIVHCSSPNTVDSLVELARPNVYFETCIQYLWLDDNFYRGQHPEHYIMQPPLRREMDGARLWQHYAKGNIPVLSTDHCDYSLTKKQAKNDFRVTAGGIPGLETLLPLSFTLFNAEPDYLNMLNYMVEVLCENPAKLFGLYPQKGVIRPGSDADVVIYDPEPEVTITQENLHTIGGYCPYEGMKVRGKVRTTISRGAVIIDNGDFTGEIGRGQFLPGKPFQPLNEII